MSAMRKLRVLLRYSNIMEGRSFDDWYDFADWVKQQNLKGIEITIIEWKYQG
jgi:hypothetical protein